MSALLTLDSLTAVAPDGRPLFNDLTLTVGPNDRVGLVGRNGSGKSTLLAIIDGRLRPAAGHVALAGRVGTLAQEWPAQIKVAEAVGAIRIREATRRVESGRATEEDFALADWTLEARVASAFASTGLHGLSLDRRIGSLSGGERTRVGLARLLIEAPDLLLLDEPTNNLDSSGREVLEQLLDRWPGGAVIASHDRRLLERVDRIIELGPLGVRHVGGGWSEFAAARDSNRDRALAMLGAAERSLAATKSSAQARRESRHRRERVGKAYAASGSAPKILLGGRAARAQNSAGRDGKMVARRLEQASQRLADARAEVEITTPLMFDIPPCHLPAGRDLLSLEEATVTLDNHRRFGPWTFSIRGPERVAISGPNGVGKSTLLRLAVGTLTPSSGTVRRADGRLSMVDQHVQLLDPNLTIVENYQAQHPWAGDQHAQAALARFAFRNRDARRLVRTLSGGERLRAGLACVLGGPLPPQLLALDEPTNHVDLATLEVLEDALSHYGGALLVVSHDRSFLEAIGLEREIELKR